MTTRAPSGRSFEDLLLDELLAVQEDLQRAEAKPEKRLLSRTVGAHLRLSPRAGPGFGPPPRRSAPRGRWRAVVVVAGLSAVIVAAALVMANLPSSGQRVTIRPAAQGTLAPGTIIVAQQGGTVCTYGADAAGDAAPQTTISSGMTEPMTLAFDHSGDLWVADENSNKLLEFTKAVLAKPNPKPSVTISPGVNVLNPYGMAFDRAGDLWLVNNGFGTVLEFTRAQLARSGSPAPVKTISGSYFNSPVGAAFDSSGDLWVANTNRLVEFDPKELAKAHPSPSLTISANGSSIDGANPVHFDHSGNLWVGDWNNDSIVEFKKSQLAKSGDPVPAVTISGHSISGPYMAFDPAGDMWVSNWGNSTMVEFAKSQLAHSGDPVPVRTVSGPKTQMGSPTYLLVEP
jgi:hypothetical protein